MKRYFLAIIYTLPVLFLACCGGEEKKEQKGPDKFAIALADSINDKAELARWIEHYDSLGDRHSSLVLRQKYGSALRNASEFEAAIKTHGTCIKDAKDLCDTLQLIIAYNNQGTNFRRLGDLVEAGNFHYAALELCDKITDDTTYTARKNVVRTLNGLGNVMLSLNNNEVAENMFRRALKGERELGSLTGEAINLANIGAIKEREGQLDSARIYYSLSLEKNIAHNNKIGISLCYQNIGNIDEMEGNIEMAKRNYLESYNIGKSTNDIWHWLNSCTALAELHLKNQEIDSAEYYTTEALEAAEKINAKGRLPHIYKLHSEVLKERNDLKGALEYTDLAHIYSDSINSEENKNHLYNLRIKYEVEKRDAEVKKAQANAEDEKKLRETITWSVSIVIILAILTLIALIIAGRNRKRANIILKKTDEERRQFYRSATHQLKTPLTVIMGMTEELKKHIPKDNEVAQKEYDAILRKGNDLVELVTRITAYNAGELDKIDHSELAQTDEDVAENNYAELVEKGNKEEYILVAEDDKDVAFMITQMLKNQGYNFKWAANGKDAYSLIMEKIPRLLITDVMMPEMDGLELIKLIREDTGLRHLPIIIVSARTDKDDRLAGIDAGAEVYLGKPFIPDELLLRVRKLIEQREILKAVYGEKIEEADRYAQDEMIKNLKENDKEFIKKIDTYIHENIMDCKLNAAMLATFMASSISTLNRRISNITGQNTTNYIRSKRLGRAKYLLKNTDMNMGEIQDVCGFESPSYFSRAFKGEYGVTPSEFRKADKNGK